MRTLFIAGNWKMNPTSREAAVNLADAVKTGVGQAANVHVAIIGKHDAIIATLPIIIIVIRS